MPLVSLPDTVNATLSQSVRYGTAACLKVMIAFSFGVVGAVTSVDAGRRCSCRDYQLAWPTRAPHFLEFLSF
jgi:hypothetical protein